MSGDGTTQVNPSRLRGRHVVLGVAGGIAAYKAVELCRLLTAAGARVSPVLTAEATRFVGTTTFSALASDTARTSLWDDPDPVPHVALGRAADLVLVAPATARLLGSYAHGISDDLLTAALLATRAPVVVCPAMHTEMWEHAAVQANVAQLVARGVRVVDPGVGPLAGGDHGVGRLADLGAILAAAEAALTPADLAGVTVLVTAGGTREPIDPVRFLGNRSSGKQGHAVAAEALARGARVIVVTTTPPTGLLSRAEIIRVETAAEMETIVLDRAAEADVVVMAAAVADFRPKAVTEGKLSKADGVFDLVLEPTTDILTVLGRRKRPGQVLVGFAAETGDLRAGALAKLTAKGADLMVANEVGRPGSGFEGDTNRVVLFGPGGLEQDGGLIDKRSVAAMVLDAVVDQRKGRQEQR